MATNQLAEILFEWLATGSLSPHHMDLLYKINIRYPDLVSATFRLGVNLAGDAGRMHPEFVNDSKRAGPTYRKEQKGVELKVNPVYLSKWGVRF